MEIELSRRSFIIVLGAATSMVAVARRQPHVSGCGNAAAPFFYFSPACPEPTARPRTTAITYLPLPPA